MRDREADTDPAAPRFRYYRSGRSLPSEVYRMEGRGGVFLVAIMIIASLAAFTMVPSLRQRIPLPPSDGAPKAAKPADGFHGKVPASFSISGGLSGHDAAMPGFGLPNSTVIKVRGTSASASGTRIVERLWGAERLTGEESYSFKGRLDRRRNSLSGRVVWTLRGRAGQRLVDWRFSGAMRARFSDPTSLKGTVSGVALDEERYESSPAAPKTTRTSTSWDFDGLRGK